MGVGAKLYRGNTLLGIAYPEAFANFAAPTSTELNNYASALVYNVTCALNEAGTKFDLGDSDSDDSLTFCSTAGSSSPTFYNPSVIYEVNRSSNPLAVDQANTAFNQISFPDTDEIWFIRFGKPADVPWAAGDIISMVKVTTDFPVENGGSGDNASVVQTPLPTGDINWNYQLAS